MNYLEDFAPGQVLEFTTEPVSADEIKAFARQWDPQPLHLDEDHATRLHGSLIASGFHTMLLVYKPIIEQVMARTANLGGLGFDNLRWHHPLRPDEPLSVRIEITGVRPSRSKPDRGVLSYHLSATNPAGQLVFSADVPVMLKRCPERQAAQESANG